MRGLGNGAFDPQTLVLLETAFDEAWLTLKSTGNKTVKPDELARPVLHLAIEGGTRSRSITRRGDCYTLAPGARRADRGMSGISAGRNAKVRCWPAWIEFSGNSGNKL